jgi:hypothetical protein
MLNRQETSKLAKVANIAKTKRPTTLRPNGLGGIARETTEKKGTLQNRDGPTALVSPMSGLAREAVLPFQGRHERPSEDPESRGGL